MADIREQIAKAIRSIQHSVTWKPGSDIRHLDKRKRRGHLPVDATVADYEQLIRAIASDNNALVYLYDHEHSQYIAIAGKIQVEIWMVIGLNQDEKTPSKRKASCGWA